MNREAVACPKNGTILATGQILKFSFDIDSTEFATPPRLELHLQNRQGVKGELCFLLPVTTLNFVRLKELSSRECAEFSRSEELFECEYAIQSLDLVDSLSICS